MRVGIIGAGVIADFHYQAIRAVSEAEPAGVYDQFPQAAQRFAAERNLIAFPTVKDLVEEGGCELVMIATPSGWHLEPCLEAVSAGAHVLCEKPLEINPDRVDQMSAACETAQRKLGAIYQFRTNPGPVKAKELIAAGELGRILVADVYIKYNRTQEYYDSAAWRGTWALDGGGATMNQGSHWIDMLQWLVGPPAWLQGFTATLGHSIEVEDIAHAVVEWTGGGRGVIEATTCANPGVITRIEIHGERGSLLLRDVDLVKAVVDGEDVLGDQVHGGSGGGFDHPTSITTAGHEFHLQDMISAIKEDRDPRVPASEARKSVEIINAIYLSSRSGQPYQFNNA